MVIGLLLIIVLRGCGVNTDSFERDNILNNKLDSVMFVVNQRPTTNEVETMIVIGGLKSEKSTLLNTNQIFLTNKRPDERVIEIDKELKTLE